MIKGLCFVSIQQRNGDNLDLPEDHELTQCFDMHSMVLSSMPPEDQDPSVTADRVIEEIDELFQVGEYLLNQFAANFRPFLSLYGLR